MSPEERAREERKARAPSNPSLVEGDRRAKEEGRAAYAEERARREALRRMAEE